MGFKTKTNTKKQKSLRRSYVPIRKSSRKSRFWLSSLGWIFGSFTLVWGILFLNNVVTLGGVPAFIVGKFLQDSTALKAFFLGQKNQLHDRLEELNIEEEIKNYYRPQIPDEIELDQHIHQILYNWTNYVGDNYQLNDQGILVLKHSGQRRLIREIQK